MMCCDDTPLLGRGASQEVFSAAAIWVQGAPEPTGATCGRILRGWPILPPPSPELPLRKPRPRFFSATMRLDEASVGFMAHVSMTLVAKFSKC